MKRILLCWGTIILAITASGQSPHHHRAETAVRESFQKFVALENQGDSLAVSKMVWQSPGFLFIATGKADVHGYVGLGTDDAMKHFDLLYRQHIHVAPDW